MFIFQKHCDRQKANLRIRFKPSLFQHVGTHSSLAGKIQKLKVWRLKNHKNFVWEWQCFSFFIIRWIRNRIFSWFLFLVTPHWGSCLKIIFFTLLLQLQSQARVLYSSLTSLNMHKHFCVWCLDNVQYMKRKRGCLPFRGCKEARSWPLFDSYTVMNFISNASTYKETLQSSKW